MSKRMYLMFPVSQPDYSGKFTEINQSLCHKNIFKIHKIYYLHKNLTVARLRLK